MCHAVTEERLREEIASGASTPRAVARGCRAGTDCGMCVQRIQALLGHTGARPCPTARLAARLGLAAPDAAVAADLAAADVALPMAPAEVGATRLPEPSAAPTAPAAAPAVPAAVPVSASSVPALPAGRGSVRPAA